MANDVRIATFNCQNLFSRPKIFEQSPDYANELLGLVAQLEAELRQAVFDHARIAQLEGQLGGFAFINDVRNRHDEVQGAGDWLGWVELVRDIDTDAAVDNTARVIRDVDADVICLIEVENRISLQLFHDDLLYRKFLQPAGRDRYTHLLLIDGNDPRGIDVSVASRLPVLWMRSHIHEWTTFDGNWVPTFSRDCLEVSLQAPDGKPLLLMVNHFKSQAYNPGSDPGGDKRRLVQATRVAELVDQHDLQQEYVVVAGDLNADSDSASLAPLIGKQGLYNANLELPTHERFTHAFEDDRQQLDYLFVSDALRDRLRNVRVERRGIYSTEWPNYPEVTSRRTQASDHGAVVAELQLEPSG